MNSDAVNANKVQIISAPEFTMFMPDYIIPQLLHEVSHYVGRKIRCREERAGYFIKILALEILNTFFDAVHIESALEMERILESDRLYILSIFERTHGDLYTYICKQLKINVGKQLDEYLDAMDSDDEFLDKDEFFASKQLKAAMLVAATITTNDLEEKSGPIGMCPEYVSQLPYDSMLRIEAFFAAQMRMIRYYLDSNVNKIYETFRESLSDLLMIRVLDLHPSTYLKGYRDSIPETLMFNTIRSIMTNEKINSHGDETATYNPVFFRICSVLKTAYSSCSDDFIIGAVPEISECICDMIKRSDKPLIYEEILLYTEYLETCDRLISAFLPAEANISNPHNDVTNLIENVRSSYRDLILFSKKATPAISKPSLEPSSDLLNQLLLRTTDFLRVQYSFKK